MHAAPPESSEKPLLPLLAEHEQRARTVLDPEVVDYYAAGSGDELTTSEAEQAWSRFRLRPHPLRDVHVVETAIELLGARVRTPVVVAPTAFHQLAHPEAECASIAGTGAAGSLFVLSTRASRPIADIAAAATGPWWFQVYMMRDREVTARVVDDAVRSGARALVLTGDTPVLGRKRRVQGLRIAVPDDQFLVNVSPYLRAGADGREAAAQDPSITLETIEWLAARSGLPVLVKGVLRGDAADDCIAAGAAGVIVSNHGGRQLDRAIPSALALAEVVQAVGGRVPVLADGGIRSGVDALVALALGASAVLVGRPVLWALAAAGSDGVCDAVEALTDDLRHTLALAGCPDLASVTPDLVTRLS